MLVKEEPPVVLGIFIDISISLTAGSVVI